MAHDYTDIHLGDIQITEHGLRQVPLVGIQDEPTRCYRVNLEWSKFVAGAIAELVNVRAWQGADDERYTAIQQLISMLEGEDCMDCAGVSDCLENDSEFNAVLSGQLAQFVLNTNNHLDNLEQQYDGTNESIAPLVPTTPAADNPDDSDALCHVVQQYVAQYARTKAAQLRNSQNQNFIWQPIIDTVQQVYGAINSVFSAVTGLNLFGLYTIDEALPALEDEIAIHDAACIWYDDLRLVVMTEANWTTSIPTAPDPPNNSHVNRILRMMNAEVANTRGYVGFLEAYNAVLQQQDNGAIFACDCDDGTWWEYDVPFAMGTGGWYAQDNAGIYENGRWRGEDVGDQHAIVLILDFGQDVDVWGVEFDIERIGGVGNGTDDVERIRLRPIPDDATGENLLMSEGFKPNGIRTVCRENPTSAFTCQQIVVDVRVQDTPTGDIYLDRLRVFGEGGTPFGATTAQLNDCP